LIYEIWLIRPEGDKMKALVVSTVIALVMSGCIEVKSDIPQQTADAVHSEMDEMMSEYTTGYDVQVSNSNGDIDLDASELAKKLLDLWYEGRIQVTDGTINVDD
jgi:uncharacterized protein YceK